MRTLTTVGAAVAISVGMAAGAAGAKDFSGKTIEFIVPAGAGGGLTRQAQLFTKFYARHITGNPTIVIKNMPGAGGARGVNFVYQRGKKDGTTIGWTGINLPGKLAGLPGISYDPAKLGIIAMGGDSTVTLVRSDLAGGVKKPTDISKVNELVTGGIGVGRSLDIYTQMTFDLLGIRIRHIPSYRAQPKIKTALLNNEIQGLTTGNSGYWAFYARDLVKKGIATTLFYHSQFDRITGKLRDLGNRFGDDVRSFPETYRKIKGKEPSGAEWEAYKWYGTFAARALSAYTPPGTPNDTLQELRTAFAKTVQDKELQAQFMKRARAVPSFLIGEKAEEILANYRKISPEALAYLKKIIGTK